MSLNSPLHQTMRRKFNSEVGHIVEAKLETENTQAAKEVMMDI